MFTGIIESIGVVKALIQDGDNLHISIEADFVEELKVDQSIAHNGVCLTVTQIQNKFYTVTAILETLSRTNLGELKVGDLVNLERCVMVGDRLDGHIVQGHVDLTAECIDIKSNKGSWEFTFSYPDKGEEITVSKGSVCVNGISLTVVNSDNKKRTFSVAIIPYTFEHTNFKQLEVGSKVNIEFDIVGKYVAAIAGLKPE